MKTLADRILWARKQLGLTQTALAKKVNISRNAISLWESGDTKSIKSEHLLSTAAALKVDPDWLIRGKGLPNNLPPTGIEEAQALYNPANRIPVISAVAAGNWITAEDPYQIGDADDWIQIDGTFGERSFALIVQGDSMTSPNPPSIPNGTIIIVDPDIQPEHGSLVIAKLTDSNEATFKRLSIDSNKRYLEPLNPRYLPIEINGNCTIIGVVKQAVMKF